MNTPIHVATTLDWLVALTTPTNLSPTNSVTTPHLTHTVVIQFSCWKGGVKRAAFTWLKRRCVGFFFRAFSHSNLSWLCAMTRSCVTWLIHAWRDPFMCDVTHSCVTWLIHVWRDSFMCDVTHSCACRFVEMFVCDVTHSCAWFVCAHIKESRYTYEWFMSHIWMIHVTHMSDSCHTYKWVTSHIWTSHVAHMNESWHTYEGVMAHIWMSHVTNMKEEGHDAAVSHI